TGSGPVSSGSYSVPSTLSFTGGTHDLAAGSSVTGTGIVRFQGATVNVLGSYTPTKTELVSGTANFESAAQTTQLAQSGGTMGGESGSASCRDSASNTSFAGPFTRNRTASRPAPPRKMARGRSDKSTEGARSP